MDAISTTEMVVAEMAKESQKLRSQVHFVSCSLGSDFHVGKTGLGQTFSTITEPRLPLEFGSFRS